MNGIVRDPLLAIARGLLYALMAIMSLAAAACVIAIPAILIMRGEVIAEIAKEMPGVPAAEVIPAIAFVLLLAAVLLAMVALIMLLLKRIVDTVAQGDPFVPENALRLTRMAWLSLGVQLVSLPMAGVGLWLAERLDGTGGKVHIDGGISGNGLLLMLILFILARVFRKGAEMRAELEGTV